MEAQVGGGDLEDLDEEGGSLEVDEVYGNDHNSHANYFGLFFGGKSLWGLRKINFGVNVGA